ncbi:paeninodin family lasso peptide [Fredinandcohnia humi]
MKKQWKTPELEELNVKLTMKYHPPGSGGGGSGSSPDSHDSCDSHGSGGGGFDS